MNWKDRFRFDPSICHGQSTVAGTRVMVSVVLDNLAAGLSREKILRSYPGLVDEDITDCLSFAANLTRAPRESDKSNWIAEITGICNDDPGFDEIVWLGQELRDAQKPDDD
jgi:uncharacterized protein (DUF433 family)